MTSHLRVLSACGIVGLVLAGCVSQPLTLDLVTDSGGRVLNGGSKSATPAPGLGGPLVPVTTLISNNASSIVSNNASSLTGVVLQPAQFVAQALAGYRVAALSELPLQRALVYLSDAQERMYLDPDSGQAITTTTDEDGRFSFPKAPASDSLVVNAVLSGNRRMVGFIISRPKENQVSLNVASTLVTEFLRSRAAAAGGKTMASYDPELRAIPDLVQLTKTALGSGKLTLPDLSVGRIAEMNRQYLVEFATRSKALKAAWEALLGQQLLVIETVAGDETGFGGDGGPASQARLQNPNGAFRAPDGSIYLADTGNNRIRKISPSGIITTVAGGGTDEDIASRIEQAQIASPIGDGGPATGAILDNPRGVVVLSNGAMVISEFSGCRIRYVSPDGTIQTLLGSTNGQGSKDGVLATTSPRPAVFFPMGLALGPDDAVYIADTRQQVVRKLTFTDPADVATAKIERVAGMYKQSTQARIPDGSDALTSKLLAPGNLCVGDDGDLYIALLGTNRVVRLDAAGKLYNVAGDGSATSSGDGGPATEAGLPIPYALAYDRTNHRLLVGNWQSPRVRSIDLGTGVISTLAGAGTSSQDGLTSDAALTDLVALMMEPDGNILLCEAQRPRLRRLWLAEPHE